MKRISNDSEPPPKECAGLWLVPGALILLLILVWPGGPLVSAAALPKCEAPPVFHGTPSRPAAAGNAAGTSIRVVSLNMHGKSDWEVVQTEVEAIPQLADADVFLLQEVKEDGRKLVEEASEATGFYYLFSPVADWGLAILSRFPLTSQRAELLPQNNLVYQSRCRISLSAIATSDSGILNLFNVHLDVRINASRSVRQVRPVMEAARQADGPSLIAGDFNTANLLWIQSMVPIPFLGKHTRAVKRAMKEIGFTTPFRDTGATFDFPPLKLDWIFLKGLRALERGLVDLDFTDHKALWVVLEKEVSGPGC